MYATFILRIDKYIHIKESLRFYFQQNWLNESSAFITGTELQL